MKLANFGRERALYYVPRCMRTGAAQQKRVVRGKRAMQTIWFIRHGESEGNVGVRTIDPASIQLTTKGQEQARQVAQAFHEAPALIVTSPYMRAKQTALATMK